MRDVERRNYRKMERTGQENWLLQMGSRIYVLLPQDENGKEITTEHLIDTKYGYDVIRIIWVSGKENTHTDRLYYVEYTNIVVFILFMQRT